MSLVNSLVVQSTLKASSVKTIIKMLIIYLQDSLGLLEDKMRGCHESMICDMLWVGWLVQLPHILCQPASISFRKLLQVSCMTSQQLKKSGVKLKMYRRTK